MPLQTGGPSPGAKKSSGVSMKSSILAFGPHAANLNGTAN
ncbi:hypothetical protein HKBW3S43_00652 [Candidatus Hakubella thermalkaliphila]|uniref:Uncharacterized protein n=1 Tax=Candidatus Hakubella thermalkaliphila TaxID=2754717 RepID=A0A6V8PRZ9_9ACTN|nr:hypothetical protein HKBW3S43_00652 [Candidatus Hakubella thermalkaliphila]